MTEPGPAVQALAGDDQHEDRRDDSRDADGPEGFEDHPVGVHQPHPVGHEKERHGPQQEPRRGAHRLGPHPAQAQRSKEQDHADDVARHVTSGDKAQRIAYEPEKKNLKKSCHRRSTLAAGLERSGPDFSAGPGTLPPFAATNIVHAGCNAKFIWRISPAQPVSGKSIPAGALLERALRRRARRASSPPPSARETPQPPRDNGRNRQPDGCDDVILPVHRSEYQCGGKQ